MAYNDVDPTDNELKDDLSLLGRMATLLQLRLSMGALAGGLNDELEGLATIIGRIRQRLTDLPPTTLLKVDPRLGEATASLLVRELGGEVPDTVPEDFDAPPSRKPRRRGFTIFIEDDSVVEVFNDEGGLVYEGQVDELPRIGDVIAAAFEADRK